MNKVKYSLNDQYTQLPNELINDFRLHPMARFLFSYLACQSDSFRFNNTILCRALGDCHEDTLRKYMKELVEAGYVSRERVRHEGKLKGWEYELHPQPTMSENFPHGKKASLEKNKPCKSPTYNKEEVSNKNKYITNSLSPASEENENPNPQLIARTGGRELVAWDADEGKRFHNAYEAVANYLRENPHRVGQIPNEARNALTSKADLNAELKAWLRYRVDEYSVMTNPAKALTSGKGNFISWLAQPHCRKKYEAPANTGKYAAAGVASNQGYNLRKMIAHQNAPRYD